jgi:diguanylate cyclase (GGDEF)-like protein
VKRAPRLGVTLEAHADTVDAEEEGQMTLCAGDLSFYQALVEHGRALVGVGSRTEIRFLSPSVASTLGWGPAGFPSPFALADGIVHLEDRDRLAASMSQAASTKRPAEVQIRVRHADERFVTLDCVVQDLREDERVRAFLVEAWDVSAREEAYQRAALYDALTGLPNRVLFTDRLAHALHAQQRHSGRVGVMYLDLDDFKAVNDEYGHAVGDAVLQEVGRRLLSAVRPGDTAARLSGDEFAVLCEHLADIKAGYDVARRVEQALDTPIRVHGVTLRIGASIGVGLALDPLVPPEQLIASADSDMYKVKRRKTPPS